MNNYICKYALYLALKSKCLYRGNVDRRQSDHHQYSVFSEELDEKSVSSLKVLTEK
jgi:hypothetical protein